MNIFKNRSKMNFLFAFFGKFDIIESTGVWRSLVARSAGGREVAGSNPVTPTTEALDFTGSQGFFIILFAVYISILLTRFYHFPRIS